jgi:hypothetical protein
MLWKDGRTDGRTARRMDGRKQFFLKNRKKNHENFDIFEKYRFLFVLASSSSLVIFFFISSKNLIMVNFSFTFMLITC